MIINLNSYRFGVAYDPDAQTYITAVETADGQALETGVKDAINAFVVGCKSDGIWTPIKACCILCGARTLTGALVPLVGTAPTNNNFVSGDYDRKTGLIGNGSTKYLNTNRNSNADPQNSHSMSVYVSTLNSRSATKGLIGAGLAQTGTSAIFSGATGVYPYGSRSRSATGDTLSNGTPVAGFVAINRSSSANYVLRYNENSTTFTRTSETPINQNIIVFGRDLTAQSDGRFALPRWRGAHCHIFGDKS